MSTTKQRIKLSHEDRLAVRRLRRLAAHVRNPKKRGLDKFDFDYVTTENACGTKGCALGELPFCFPRHFVQCRSTLNGKAFSVARKDGAAWSPFEDASKFFHLTIRQRDALFVPSVGDVGVTIAGLKRLGKRAKAVSVAANIDRFCDLVESGQEQLQTPIE